MMEYETFEAWWGSWDKKNQVAHSQALVSLISEAWHVGSDWWILSTDMWIEGGHEYPVPDTWDEALKVMSECQDFDAADWYNAPVLCIRDSLADSDQHHCQELAELITDALYDGANHGWRQALKYQDNYYGLHARG